MIPWRTIVSYLTAILSLLSIARPCSQAQNLPPQSHVEQAWVLLNEGATSTSAETRRAAIGALGIIRTSRRAAEIAEHALNDDKPEVRAAAAIALGQMESSSSTAKLIEAIDDKDPSVMLAAAQSLVRLKNEKGYDVYYEILTGQRKGGKSAIAAELDTLKNPKKLAELGFEEGIGFVPFGGMGLETLHVLRGGSNSGVRAAAAKVLAFDPEPAAETALSDATGDTSWHVRVAAIDAIAERGNPKLLAAVEGGMQDGRDAVKYSAAAAVVRLSDIKPRRRLRLPKKESFPRQP